MDGWISKEQKGCWRDFSMIKTALAKDPGSKLNIHMTAISKLSLTQVPVDPMPFWPPRTLHKHDTQTFMEAKHQCT